jgi:hypothetical protein
MRFLQFGQRVASIVDPPFRQKRPVGTKVPAVRFTKALLGEKTMQAAIDRVMQTYCMIEKLTAEEAQAAREKVSSYLAEKPEADERALAIEGLRYLRSARA